MRFSFGGGVVASRHPCCSAGKRGHWTAEAHDGTVWTVPSTEQLAVMHPGDGTSALANSGPIDVGIGADLGAVATSSGKLVGTSSDASVHGSFVAGIPAICARLAGKLCNRQRFEPRSRAWIHGVKQFNCVCPSPYNYQSVLQHSPQVHGV
mmetsp:Transcript_69286/g.202855  ORF Transcript_69286/g.202855 Transcript_69286/m.202855 type:complete len:151 (+) Transcript_69286:85-537(+)